MRTGWVALLKIVRAAAHDPGAVAGAPRGAPATCCLAGGSVQSSRPALTCGADAAQTCASHPQRGRSRGAWRAQRLLTTAAHALVRRSRRTARRAAARRGTRARGRCGRSRPKHRARPRGAGCPFLSSRELMPVAGRDRTRSATAPPGSAAHRATAPRSTPATAAHAGRQGPGASRQRSHRPSGGSAG